MKKILAFTLMFSSVFYLFLACQQPSSINKVEAMDMNDDHLEVNLRFREETGAGDWKMVESMQKWDPSKTAIIVVDMWDKHWCESASERVGELGPIMNNVVNQAREKGVMIIHAPSGTMKTYQDYPQRKRAQAAKTHTPPQNVHLEQWCYLDPKAEASLPIDDSDGGCDKPCADGVPCVEKEAWSSQVESIGIHEADFITDKGQEVYNIFQEHGIENLMIMGVHTNMCILGRPFAIRQMANLGMNVALVRDMTDAMYNPAMPPHVDHFTGTDLVIEHIEKYWSPTLLSSDITGMPSFRFKEDKRNL